MPAPSAEKKRGIPLRNTPLGKMYLVAYNGAMCLGWGAILAKVTMHYFAGGKANTVYDDIRNPLIVFQTGAIAEVVHAAIGLVPSGVGTTLLQVLSRLIVLYGAIEVGETDARRSPFFTQMVAAWSLAEIIRYSYYVTSIFNIQIKAHSWLRYSAFMVLYPVGITGEVIALIKALPFIKENRPLSAELPNKYNGVFSWYYFTIFLLVAVYPYGSYVMYSHMLRQRKKALAKVAVGVAKKSA